MFVRRNYKVRHLLLKVLFDHDQNNDKPIDDVEGRSIHFDEICKKLPQFDRWLLLDNLDYLRSIKEIYCSDQFDKSKFLIYSSGSHSYRDKKYLREGVKDQINYIYDIVKTISVIVLLGIAIWTFAQNLYQTKKNKDEIEQLKNEVLELRKNQTTVQPSNTK